MAGVEERRKTARRGAGMEGKDLSLSYAGETRPDRDRGAPYVIPARGSSQLSFGLTSFFNWFG